MSERTRRLDDAFHWLMSDARGRLLMWERLSDAGVFRSSMNASPYVTAFNEGQREAGLRDLARIMRLCPALYAVMAEEAQRRGESDDGRSSRDTTT
jgi:hypothetical protein